MTAMEMRSNSTAHSTQSSIAADDSHLVNIDPRDTRTNALRLARNPVAGAREAMQRLTELEEEDLQRIVQSVPGGWTYVTDICPLSPLQEVMLFHCLLNRDSDTYVLSTLFEFESRVHLQKWISAVNKVIGRHDILRTSIRWEGLPKPV